MENSSALNLNIMRERQNKKFGLKFICDVAPQSSFRNLTQHSERYLNTHNPISGVESLPKQIALALEFRVNSNPDLVALLKKYNLNHESGNYLDFVIYTDTHMQLTAKIAEKLCDELKITDKRATIVKASRLHDMGKIFIPESILNKPADLSVEEKTIIDSHAELGSALLKTLNVDEETLNLIKNHHNIDETSSIAQQIVSISDVYAALIEKRHYKPSLSSKIAINIIEQRNFSKEVVDALKKITAGKN